MVSIATGGSPTWIPLTIAMALVVWRIGSPLRGHNVGYSFWHTLWHVLVFFGQLYICASIPAATR